MRMSPYTAGGICRCDFNQILEIGRLFWIICLRQIPSQKSCEDEAGGLSQRRRCDDGSGVGRPRRRCAAGLGDGGGGPRPGSSEASRSWGGRRQVGCSPADGAILAQGNPFRSSHTHNGERVDLRCFKALILWQFVIIGVVGKESACNAGDLGSILGSGRSPEKGKATHSSTLAWRIPWTIQSVGSQRVGHD